MYFSRSKVFLKLTSGIVFKNTFTLKDWYIIIITLKVENVYVNLRWPLTKKVKKINISSTWSLLCFFGQPKNMFILIIKLNNILKFDMLRLDLWLLHTFLNKDHEMYNCSRFHTKIFYLNFASSQSKPTYNIQVIAFTPTKFTSGFLTSYLYDSCDVNFGTIWTNKTIMFKSVLWSCFWNIFMDMKS